MASTTTVTLTDTQTFAVAQALSQRIANQREALLAESQRLVDLDKVRPVTVADRTRWDLISREVTALVDARSRLLSAASK